MSVYDEYRAKLRSPEEAVKAVKSGEWVDYPTNICFPTLLDEALAARRDELENVKFRELNRKAFRAGRAAAKEKAQA